MSLLLWPVSTCQCEEPFWPSTMDPLSQFSAHNLCVKRFPNILPIGENLGCVAATCTAFKPKGPPCALTLFLPSVRLSGEEGCDYRLVRVIQGEHQQ